MTDMGKRISTSMSDVAARNEETENDELEREQGEKVMDDSDATSERAMQSNDLPDEGMSVAMQVRDRIIAVIKTVYDPEIPVDIYELGLVYGVEVTDDGEAHVTMTLTSPMCPVAETLPPEVEDKIRNVIGVKDVSLDLVWDPPWSVDMMSDAARLELNMM